MRGVFVLLVMVSTAVASATALPPPPPPPPPPPRTLVLCFEDSDIPPWRMRNQTGHNFRLLDAVARNTSVRFVYRGLPWRRCQSDLAEGRVDGAFANSYTPERRAIGLYPPGATPDAAPDARFRLFSDGYALVRRRGDGVRLQDGRIVGLTGPVGSQAGYSIVDDLRRKGIAVEEGSPDPMALLRKLAEGRVGAAALGISKMRELEATGDPVFARIETLPEPLVRKDYFLMVSRQRYARDPALVQALWEAVAEQRDRIPVGMPGVAESSE
jgi:polar amino acid transport system substrate-binding protein